MKRRELGLHKNILPSIHRLHLGDGFDYIDSISSAVVFDCRALPHGFIYNTGEAAYEESEALMEKVRLPFPRCYFEFSDGSSIYAQEIDHYIDNRSSFDTSVEIRYFDDWNGSNKSYHDSMCLYGEFVNNIDILTEIAQEEKFFTICENIESDSQRSVSSGKLQEEKLFLAARKILGILCLLNEHLLTTEFISDPYKKINIKRKKHGVPPISCDRRVLTINTAAVRKRAIKRTDNETHESPCLHWRRGHWRVLNRGSEFERKTWVRRCLAGDPDRGFIDKDYRLIWSQPLFNPESEIA